MPKGLIQVIPGLEVLGTGSKANHSNNFSRYPVRLPVSVMQKPFR